MPLALVGAEQQAEAGIGDRCHLSGKIKLPPCVHKSPPFDISWYSVFDTGDLTFGI
jgi:hypothetical protein